MSKKYVDLIINILNDTPESLSAELIQKALTNDKHFQKSGEPITKSQIRNRIRDNGDIFNTSSSSPLLYSLKNRPISMINCNLWVLKTVSEKDRSFQTIDSYEDNLKEHYNYDNFVANSQQINDGDLAILIDKKKILGFAKTEHITQTAGLKIIRRCPVCDSTTIDSRKKKLPVYRCNNGHEFEFPIEEEKEVKKYKASFNNSFVSIGSLNSELSQLRPYYTKGYNQNMSMQLLDIESLNLFPTIKNILISQPDYSLSPHAALTKEDENEYVHTGEDERMSVNRTIMARRGQKTFRETLLAWYNSTCLITGCQIIDILEAAHIRPYRGDNDNHPSNGLLLRADIHTLFDLNLVAIEPETLMIHFHPKVLSEYKLYNKKVIQVDHKFKPNKEALVWRFQNFSTS